MFYKKATNYTFISYLPYLNSIFLSTTEGVICLFNQFISRVVSLIYSFFSLKISVHILGMLTHRYSSHTCVHRQRKIWICSTMQMNIHRRNFLHLRESLHQTPTIQHLKILITVAMETWWVFWILNKFLSIFIWLILAILARVEFPLGRKQPWSHPISGRSIYIPSGHFNSIKRTSI